MTELAAIKVRIDGDSGGLTAAVRAANDSLTSLGKVTSAAEARARGLDAALAKSNTPLTQMQRNLNSLIGVMDKLPTSAATSALAFAKFDQMAQGVDNLRAQFDPLFASSKRYEAAVQQLDAALEAGVISQSQYNHVLDQAKAAYLGAAGQAGRFGRSMDAASAQTANLTFQLQDIGMMLAAGQSPLMLAMQQGTQVSGIFMQMGASAKTIGPALRAAFASLLTPLSLITIGGIAAVAAITQLAAGFFSGAEGSEKLAEAAERQAAVLDRLTEATARLRIERQMLDSGAQTSLEQEALNEINALLARRQELTAQLEEQYTTMRRAAGVGAKAVSDAQQQEINREIAIIDQKLRRLRYEEDLATASRRRANDVRNAYREEAAAEQARIAAVARLQSAFDGVTSAAQGAARAAASIGTAAQGAIGGVQALAGAMWEAAQARVAMIEGMAGQQTRMIDDERGGQRDQRRSVDATMPDQPWMNTGGGGGGGGGGGASALQSEIEAMQEALMTQEQLQMESFIRQQEMLDQALQQRLITQEEYQRLMQQAQATHDFAMTQSVNKGVTDTLGALGQLFQGSKKIGAAIALANSWIAFTEVLKDPAYVGRPWARIAAAGKALAAGLNAVRNIKSASPGGSAGGGGGSGAGMGSAAQQNVQTMNFTITSDRFGFGENVIRQIAAQLNQASRNGTQIRATVS